jgi:hypothetical protein
MSWADTAYNARDRTDSRLGVYYEYDREVAMLDPVIQSLNNRAVTEDPSPFVGPSLDHADAYINPQLLDSPNHEPNRDWPSEICSDCNKTFTGPNALKNLKRHIHRSHNPQIVRYKCKELDCSFESIKKTDVQRHYNSVHSTTQMLYSCTGCEMRFNRKDNQQRHIQKKHTRPLA